MTEKFVIKINVIDKNNNVYPDLFIKNLEESLVFIANDYDKLEQVRQRMLWLIWWIKKQQGEIKYGHLKTYEVIHEESNGD